MKYVAAIIMSLPILAFPFIGNKSISWEAVVIILGYFWVGVVIGEEIGKGK